MKQVISLILVSFAPFISGACVHSQTIPTFHPLELVVKGSTASEGQFPYLVSLQFTGEGHQCGGSIVNKRWILTAAHCINHDGTEKDVSVMQILAGTNHLDQGGDRYKIIEKHVHENYHYEVNENDIALLKTDRDIQLSSKVSIIPLSSSEVPAGSSVLSGGWGESTTPRKATNDLQFIEMTSLNLVTCRYNFPHIDVFDHNICTQPTRGQGTCLGDSGGPLVYGGQLVGVLSWGEECGGPAPEVYSKVSSFLGWIRARIN